MKAHTQTGDDVRGVSRNAGFRHLADRRIARRSVVVGDKNCCPRHQKPKQRRKIDPTGWIDWFRHRSRHIARGQALGKKSIVRGQKRTAEIKPVTTTPPMRALVGVVLETLTKRMPMIEAIIAAPPSRNGKTTGAPRPAVSAPTSTVPMRETA